MIVVATKGKIIFLHYPTPRAVKNHGPGLSYPSLISLLFLDDVKLFFLVLSMSEIFASEC